MRGKGVGKEEKCNPCNASTKKGKRGKGVCQGEAGRRGGCYHWETLKAGGKKENMHIKYEFWLYVAFKYV